MTFSTEKHESLETAWQQLERLVDSLHELARTPIDPTAFYRRLLEDCVTTLAAGGGAVWRRDSTGRWATGHQVNLEAVIHHDDFDLQAAHQRLLDNVAHARETAFYPPMSGAADEVANPTNALILAGHVLREADEAVVIELFVPAGRSPS
ncbi:MAG: hypothetical protein MI725_06485, partial [Pirellulales bacterium]|nr:hypothetical protein [Pirellulales bacterium]